MNVCEQCDRGHHRRCAGKECECIFCPIYNRRVPVAKMITPRKSSKSSGSGRVRWNGPTGNPRGRPRAPMDGSVKASIVEGLLNGTSQAKIAKSLGITRDRVRTVKKDLDKLAKVV